jgi:hypothetical protein
MDSKPRLGGGLLGVVSSFSKSKLLFVLSLSLLALRAAAQTPSKTEQVIDAKDLQNCGLITRFPGDIINSNCFQQETNMLSDRTGVPTRRNGYSAYNGTACPGSQPIRGMWPFFAQSGIQYLIMYSSNSLFYSPGDGTCNYITQMEGQLSGTATMECTQLNGYLWCTDGIDPVFGTNVISTQAAALNGTAAPTGYHIGTFRNRLLISGIPGVGSNGSASEVYLSGELNPLDYNIPAIQLTTSPAIISINGINDGIIVNCLMGEFQNQFLIGRNYDLWGLSGYDLSNFTLRKISSQVGCLEPRSIQEVTNVLYWLSYRGIEGYSGTQINRVSYPIDSQILPIIASAGNTETYSLASESEWQLGNLIASGPGAALSATIDPGSVVPSSWSFIEPAYDTFTVVTSTFHVSTSAYVGSVILSIDTGTIPGANTLPTGSPGSGNWFFTSGSVVAVTPAACGAGSPSLYSLEISLPGSCASQSNTTQESVGIFNANTSFFIVDQTKTGPFTDGCSTYNEPIPYQYSNNSSNQWEAQFEASGQGIGGGALSPIIPGNTLGDNIVYTVNYADSGGQCLVQFNIWQQPYYYLSGSYKSEIFNTEFSTPTWSPFEASVSSGQSVSSVTFTSQVSSTMAGPFDTAQNITLGSKIQSAQKQYIIYTASFTVNYSSVSFANVPQVNATSLSAESTGYYITPCVEVSSPSSYGNFLVDAETDGGQFTFWTSTGATCSAATNPNTTWTPQIPNSVITASTSTTYIASRVLFYVDVATEVPTLNSITFTWNNGAKRPPTASARWDDRYLLFFTTNTASNAVNDHVFIYDQNQKWQLWDDEYAASATLFQNTLYTGDSNATGIVYQQDVGSTDGINQNPFTMTFQTADFDGGDPNMNKQFSRAYFLLGAPSNSNGNAALNCNYAIDGSSLTFSLGSVSLSEAPYTNGYWVAKMAFPTPAGLPTDQPVTGHWLNLTCGYTGTVGPIVVHRIRVVWNPLSWD